MRTPLVAILVLSALAAHSQTTGDYRSAVATGNWTTPGSWETYNGSTWGVAGSAPTGAETLISIRNGHNISIPQSASITVSTQLNVESGGTLTVQANVGGVKLTVSGTLVNEGTVSITGATVVTGVVITGRMTNRGTLTVPNANKLRFDGNGVYEHDFASVATAIPTATWSATSTCRIVANADVAPAGLSQTFGNFEWDYPTQTSFLLDLGGELSSVSGDLRLLSTGLNGVTLNGTNNNYNLSVGGTIVCNEYFEINSGTGQTTVTAANLTVDDPQASGFSYLGLASQDGVTNVNITGDLLIDNGGVLDFSLGSGSTVDFSVGGNVTVENAGVITSGSGSGTYVLSFNGTGTQVVILDVSLDGIDLVVENGATVSIPAGSFLGTDRSFSLGTSNGSNTTFEVASTAAGGAIQTGSSAGALRVSGNRTFFPGSAIVYNGTSSQFIGNGHPTTSGVATRIANTSGVSLISNITIGGTLELVNGNLSVGNNTLTLNGALTDNGNDIVVAPGSSLSFGSASDMVLPFPAGDQTISNVSLTGGGNVTFANNVTVSGTLTLTSGDLVFDNQTLTLNGTVTGSGGALSGNAASTLVISGTGAFGSIAFANTGNTLHTLTLNRTSSGTASLSNTVNIVSALNLLSGDLTNNGIVMANGATITRNSNAQLLVGEPVVADPGDRYNVTYTGGALITGLELPDAVDNYLLNLTINGGPVSLQKSIIVNGDINLQNSSLDASSFNITMAGSGASWNKTNGTFASSSGSVIVAGNLTITGTQTPRFGNVIVSAGAVVTMPSQTNIDGNLQIDAGSTFNHNNGIIRFNGTSGQSLSGGGKTFNNITVNKTGGTLQLTSAVNLLGRLDIQTATQLISNGALTLISTSDGDAGNAAVGALPTGASITGNVTVQRYMSSEGRIYRYVSSPVSGYTVAQLQAYIPVTGPFSGSSSCTGCTTNPSMYYYDETVGGVADNGYVAFPSASVSETLQVGLGYTPFVRQDILPGPVTIEFTGTVNQGTIDFPVTYTSSAGPSNDGWNLVGNPYPSPLDWDDATNWVKTNVSNAISVRDNGGGGVYRTWNGAAGDFNAGIIAAGQGFWVQTIGASPVLQVSEGAKSTIGGAFYRQKESPDEGVNVLELHLSDGNITDKTYLHITDKGKPGLDPFDGGKMDNVAFDLSIIAPDGRNLAIHATDEYPLEDEPVVLKIKDMEKGGYTFSLVRIGEFVDYNCFLLDRFAGKTIDLQQTPEYAFEVTSEAASSAENRFELSLAKIGGPDIPLSVDPVFNPEGAMSFIDAFPNPATGKTTVMIITTERVSEVFLMDPVGMQLGKIQVDEMDKNNWKGEIDLTGRPAGMYLVFVRDSAGKVFTGKILKK